MAIFSCPSDVRPAIKAKCVPYREHHPPLEYEVECLEKPNGCYLRPLVTGSGCFMNPAVRVISLQSRSTQKALYVPVSVSIDLDRHKTITVYSSKALTQTPINDTTNKTSSSHPAPRVVKAEVDIEEIAESVSEANKTECLKLKMTINRHIGQICDSWMQIQRIAKELLCVIRSSRDNMCHFVTLTIVDKFLNMAETQCALHPPSSFPLAAVVINISSNVEGFHMVFMKRLAQRCPPLNLQEFEDKSCIDIEKKCGIVSLYAAILAYSSQQEKGIRSNKFDVRDGWRFVASTLNRMPSIYTSAFLCFFLDQAGYALSVAFGSSFTKLMYTLRHNFIPKLPRETVSYNEALKITVDGFCKTGRPEKPKGLHINP